MKTQTYKALTTTRLAFATLALVLVGCEKADQETIQHEQVRDVEYFKANPKELSATLERCRNNPGELDESPNCENAEQAHHSMQSGPSSVDYSDAFE